MPLGRQINQTRLSVYTSIFFHCLASLSTLECWGLCQLSVSQRLHLQADTDKHSHSHLRPSSQAALMCLSLHCRMRPETPTAKDKSSNQVIQSSRFRIHQLEKIKSTVKLLAIYHNSKVNTLCTSLYSFLCTC